MLLKCSLTLADSVLRGIREAGGAREHRLRVYAELIYGHEANKPAPSTHNFNRTCMPYPFLGKMTAAEAASDFNIAIDGFMKTAHYSPGAPHRAACHASITPVSAPHEHSSAPVKFLQLMTNGQLREEMWQGGCSHCVCLCLVRSKHAWMQAPAWRSLQLGAWCHFPC